MVYNNVDVKIVPFFDSVKNPVLSNGISVSAWNVSGYKNLSLQFSGSATAFSAEVEATINTIGSNGINLTDAQCSWSPLTVVNLNGLSTSINVASVGLYTVGIPGLSRVRVNLASVSGGALTIVGALTH